MKPSRTTVSALLLAASLAAPAAARAQDAAPSIRLTPARAEGTVERGQTIGPFTILNDTHDDYDMRVFSVLLGQDRKGGLLVRDDPEALRQARRLLAVQVHGFAFPPGFARTVFGSLRRVPPGGGFYGGILFRATPRILPGRPRPQITNVLRINARITLDPPPRRRRIAWQGGPLRAEQDGKLRLRLVVPVTNRGNTFARVGGDVRIRDRAGKVVSTRPLRGLQILPGATVDMPVGVTSPRLPVGDYVLEARLRGAGKRASARGDMKLFGTNEVRTERAKIADFPVPKAYIGDETEFKATFVNTGNVRWAPAAKLEVRTQRNGQPGPVIKRVKLHADAVDPGARGEVSGKVTLPEGVRSFDVRLALLAGDRELDARSNGITPIKRPSLTTRIADFVTENAIVIVLLLLGVLAAGGLLVVRYIRRLQAAAKG
jgi:hypothetical protein